MTRKELQQLRYAIENERFQGFCRDPIAYAIERAVFQQHKFEKLIAAAQQVDCKTARAKLSQWQRQLERARQNQSRLESLRSQKTQ